MKQLKNLIALSQKVRIYVPSTVQVDTAVDSSEQVAEALGLLSRCFGGATSYAAYGAWVAASGQLVKERVTICESFCDQQALEAHIDAIYDFCLGLKGSMGQEAISLEVNGALHFV